uniref:FHL1/2/3/5 N-terminal LIM domain-containing protein n=1 Tax=Felis catus TaxID=9685 RepID=A0ABI7W3Z0_FELCA
MMTERFDCHHCEESLFGKKYILREESPYCIGCFEALYASTCEECGKPIGCDCKGKSSRLRNYQLSHCGWESRFNRGYRSFVLIAWD